MMMAWKCVWATLLLSSCQGSPEDTATTTAEFEWYRPMQDMNQLNVFCNLWDKPRDLFCYDLFSRSQRVAKTFRRSGFQSAAFDIATFAHEDILSKKGFLQAVDTALRLVDHGLIMAAVPCSLFVPISFSIHGRYAWQPLGRTANFKVRMANQIAENTIALLRLVLTARPSTLIVLENPKGSMLYQLPSVAAFLYELGFIGLLTYLGLYGMDLLKPTTANGLARKATKKVKAQFTQRIERKKARRQAKGLPAKVYYTSSVSRVGKKQFSGGPALQETSTYPQR
ncbi:unnamed protein product, partial [Durusdinium trenchii]